MRENKMNVVTKKQKKWGNADQHGENNDKCIPYCVKCMQNAGASCHIMWIKRIDLSDHNICYHVVTKVVMIAKQTSE